MGVGWKSLSHHISYIVSWVNLIYFYLPTLYEVLSESKYLRANMLDLISLDKPSSMHVSTPPHIARTSPWVRRLRGWRSLPRPLFMGVVWITGLSRRAKTLATWMCDLVTFTTLLNESGVYQLIDLKMQNSLNLPFTFLGTRIWKHVWSIYSIKVQISTWIWLSYQTWKVYRKQRIQG
jgi:hypothetical protein